MHNQGNILVPVAFLSWPVIVMLLYRKLDKRLVPVIAYVAGWMFLPCAEYDIFMLKNTKATVLAYSLLAGAWINDRDRLKNFSPRLFDLPMMLWCTAPFFASVSNGLGVYDGLSGSLYQSILWGIPYYLGRVYFTDADVLHTLALTIFIGGIIYIPFSWFELIMSPQLHRLTYGFHQHDFLQTLRASGGYRPMIFMNHGLMTAMWMMLASMVGVWLFMTKNLPKKLLFIPSWILLGMLLLTFFMYQSMAAISFFVIGITALYIGNKAKNSVPIIILLILPHLYVTSRTSGYWDGTNLTTFIAEKISPLRAQSLQFRFDNETVLINKALQGGFFGWAGYGRAKVFDEEGKDISTTDGLWVIALGNQGIYGLFWMMLCIQLPPLLLIRKSDPASWNSLYYAAPAVLVTFLSLTMIDNLINAMVNPLYLVASGGIMGLAAKENEMIAGTQEKKLGLLEKTDGEIPYFLSDSSKSNTKILN